MESSSCSNSIASALLAVAALAILTQPSCVHAQEAPWLQLPPTGEPRNASWSPRSGHTITVVDDAMILSSVEAAPRQQQDAKRCENRSLL